jgi:hypothetical protein
MPNVCVATPCQIHLRKERGSRVDQSADHLWTTRGPMRHTTNAGRVSAGDTMTAEQKIIRAKGALLEDADYGG